jgi:hypothetical protein
MQFQNITLEDLLGELAELPADWMDDFAKEVVVQLRISVGALRGLGRPTSAEDLADQLRESDKFLDVARLFLGQSQESVAHTLCAELSTESMTWPKLRRLGKQDPGRVGEALDAIGLSGIINEALTRRWEVEDVLIDRYRMTRGRAIAGQARGRALEDEVQAVLECENIPFERGVTFTGKKGETAKSDFAIPSKDHPKIVIECKGYEATGSKLTDFLGDVLKIVQAKDYHMYFFLVTDGRGWHNRVSDLRKIVEHHHSGDVDMVYTMARLADLASAVKQIHTTER